MALDGNKIAMFRLFHGEHCSFVRHLDVQANIFIGLNLGLLLFFSKLSLSLEKVYLLLFIFPVVSLVLSVFVVHPPKRMRQKNGDINSIINNKHITSFSSPQEYSQAMKEIFDDDNLLFDEIATDTYTIIKYYFRPKRTLLGWAQKTFIISLGLTLVCFILYVLFN